MSGAEASPIPRRGILGRIAALLMGRAATLLIAYPRGKVLKLPHDVSYGVYIYSWPVQQLTVFFALKWFGVALTPISLFLSCLGPLVVIALGSWPLIEKPALSLLDGRLKARRASAAA